MVGTNTLILFMTNNSIYSQPVVINDSYLHILTISSLQIALRTCYFLYIMRITHYILNVYIYLPIINSNV